MTKQKIDYKRELEAASRGMIMIHDPNLLIKLILRNIVSKVHIRHAGMILYEPRKDSYVLKISKGETGAKIPAGFARFDMHSPILRLFLEKEFKSLTVNRNALQSCDLQKLIWQENVINGGNGVKDLLHQVGDQMDMLNTVACVPAFYRHRLLAVLLLGEKIDGGRFDQDELDFFSALASDVAMAIRNAQLFDDLKKEADKNKDLFLRMTIVLGSAIEAKDKYTHGHTERVTSYSVAIARRMNENGSSDFSKDFLESLYISALLHDIGKIGVPEMILNKPGRLTDEERERMQMHTIYGVEILKPLAELKDAVDGVRHHHERYDGKGYPDGLPGEKIPIIAAIIAVADTFDAMITDRPYRKGKSREEAIQEIKKNAGAQFHPLCARAMVELYEQGRI